MVSAPLDFHYPVCKYFIIPEIGVDALTLPCISYSMVLIFISPFGIAWISGARNVITMFER